jgi:hypothetical protein
MVMYTPYSKVDSSSANNQYKDAYLSRMVMHAGSHYRPLVLLDPEDCYGKEPPVYTTIGHFASLLVYEN